MYRGENIESEDNECGVLRVQVKGCDSEGIESKDIEGEGVDSEGKGG